MGRRGEVQHPDTDNALCSCKHCGGLLNEDVLAVIRDMRERNANLAEVVARQEGLIKKIRRDQDSELTADPLYGEAVAVLEYWSEKLEPNARELRSGERIRKVLARLHGKPKAFTVDDLKRCVDGYAAFPYVISGKGRVAQGPDSCRQVKATLIFRDAETVQNGLKYADAGDRRARPAPITRPATFDLSDLGQRAVRYAEFGWHVFPVVPRSKLPATEHGFLDATRDVDRIARCWRKHPDCNIGIRCGAESELVVLDVDVGGGTESIAELEQRYEPLPRTASVVTPRGGSHFYFHHPSTGPVANTTAYPAVGLDVRGDGGYVLGVGSIGPDGSRYEPDEQTGLAEIPEWLLKLLRDRQRQAGRRVDPAEFERIVACGVREGGRNSQLTSLAGHLWSHGLSPGVVAGIVQNTNAQRCSPPLPDREVARIVQSVARMRARQESER